MLKKISMFFRTIPELSDRRLFLLILVSAFIIRFAYTLTLENKWYYYDTVHWDKAATSILNDQDFGTGYYFSALGFDQEYSLEPAYPVFLAGIYGVFGRNFTIVRVFQCLLGAAVCYLVCLIGARLFNKNTGLLAALIATFYPLHIFIAGMVYPTILFTFFIALTILCLLKVADHTGYLYPALAGLFLALATQCIPIIFAFYPFAAFWMLVLVKKSNSQRWKHCFVIFFVALLGLTPWTVRNYLVFGKIVPIRAAFGEELLKVKVMVDSNSKVDLYRNDIQNSGIDEAEFSRQVASMQSKGFFAKVKSIVLDNPGSFLRRYVGEFLHFWILYPDPERVKTKNQFLNTFTKWVSIVSFGPVLIFSIIGILGSKPKQRQSMLLVFVILSFALSYSFFMTQTRYRIPIEPYMIVLAACGVLVVTRRIFGFASHHRLAKNE